MIKPDIGEHTLRNAEAAAARESKVYIEVLNTALSCGGALISWIVVGGAASAVPLTGGTSLIVEKFAAPAALLGSFSCGNSGYRLYNELYDPTMNDDLDQEFWYQGAVAALDAVGLIGATTATHTTIKLVRHLKSTTGQTMLQVLKGLTRQQRKQLAEEAIRLANPRISGQQLKMFVRAGRFPKRCTAPQVSHTVTRQIKEALGAAAGFVGSAFDGLVNKGVQAAKEAARPSVPRKQTDYRNYVVGVVYSFETF